MSTKGLMADKRVQHVGLNAAGKAETLTLTAGWTYEGSAGPFTLTNVDHGHKIVKGAVCDNATVAKAQPRPKQPPSTATAPAPTGIEATPLPATRPSAPRGHRTYVYRWIISSLTHSHEICGWFKATERKSEKYLEEYIQRVGTAGHLGRIHPAETYTERKIFLWTQRHEKEARAAGTAGAPWSADIGADEA